MREYTLFIFRRDLRIHDNRGFAEAMKSGENVIPIFIFTPEQFTDKNKYRSKRAIEFMIESLKDLNTELRRHKSRLHLFEGDNLRVLQKIYREMNVTKLLFNRDYTPYAVKRDAKIITWCERQSIECIVTEDYLLKEIGTIMKDDGEPYTVFTPFKNRGMKEKIDQPKKVNVRNLFRTRRLSECDWPKYERFSDTVVRGGRKEGLKQLNKVKNHRKYDRDRNTLAISTTRLSAHIKFGTVSIREVYWKIRRMIGVRSDLMSQLFWRDFYYYITYYFPEVLEGKNYNPRYDKIKWKYNTVQFKKWCRGETGYPIVDAGMREMNETGMMHNRARLITANFLNRMLGHDWRVGERYFAQTLVDYDPAVNNGNWQWTASTGVDPKPYFQRLFNPWLQGERFDPKAEYIKTWLPELEDVPAKELHQWDEYYDDWDTDYPAPMIDYKKARKASIAMYRRA